MADHPPLKVRVISASDHKIESDQHTFMGHSTSTFDRTIQEQTDRIVNKTTYNPDILPYQPILLQRRNISLIDPFFRENMATSSQFIKKHSEDRIWKIVDAGWEYIENNDKMEEVLESEDPENSGTLDLEDWPPEQEDALIEGLSKALPVDSSFVCLINSRYYVFTRNDVKHNVIVNENNEIIEIYIRIPIDPIARVYRDGKLNDKARNGGVVAFLTQFAEEDVREPSMSSWIDKAWLENQGGVIYRDCVVITPRKSHKSVFGLPFLEVENEIALQKQYLRMYEFAHLHKGGVERFYALPEDSSTDEVVDPMVRSVKRGIMEQGLIFRYSGGAGEIDKQVLMQNTPIPLLPFESINSMISEDAQLPKQAIQGAAETGALGGSAPEVGQNDTKMQVTRMEYITEVVIRDFNFVFQKVESFKEEKLEGNRVRKVPIYRVIFYEQADPSQEESIEDKEQRNEGTQPNALNKTESEEHAFKTVHPSKFKKQLLEFALKNNKSKFGLLMHPEEDVKNAVSRIAKNISEDKQGNIKIYRGVTGGKEGAETRAKGILSGKKTGDFWSTTQSGAQSWEGTGVDESQFGLDEELNNPESPRNLTKIRLSGQMKISDVDWKATVTQNINYPHETEVISKSGKARLTNVEYQNEGMTISMKADQDIDFNPGGDFEDEVRDRNPFEIFKIPYGKGKSRYWGKVGEGKKQGLSDDGAHQYAKKTLKSEAHSIWGSDVEVEMHSVQGEYVKYSGNLFEAGVYNYPEKGKTVTYTGEEISDFTQLPFNKVPMEVSPHTSQIEKVGLDTWVGFADVQGYNPEVKKDMTDFYVKEDVNKALIDKGIIEKRIIVKDGKKKETFHMLVSPFFSHKIDPITKKRKIFLKTAAIVDRRFEQPRSKLTHLDTSATFTGG